MVFYSVVLVILLGPLFIGGFIWIASLFVRSSYEGHRMRDEARAMTREKNNSRYKEMTREELKKEFEELRKQDDVFSAEKRRMIMEELIRTQ